MVPQRRIERRFPPYQSGALPLDDCGRRRWCWLEDSNLPPLAYKASALPDELSQLRKLTNGSRRRSRSGSDLVGAPRLGAASGLDLHNVKERGAAGAVVIGVRVHGSSVRTDASAPPAHEMSLDVLRLVLRAICPPASTAEGTLRRLFRFQSRALLGPRIRAGATRIAERAHKQPITRTIESSGGGAGRGGDMRCSAHRVPQCCRRKIRRRSESGARVNARTLSISQAGGLSTTHQIRQRGSAARSVGVGGARSNDGDATLAHRHIEWSARRAV